MLCGDHGTVDDLFQDTFLALARHGAHLDDATSLHRWLLVVAANRGRSYRRWRFVDPTRWLVLDAHDEREPRAPEPNHAAHPEADLVARERVATLKRALRWLAESDRAPMLLALDDGLTSADRAAALGVSEAALRKRLERARARLAALLAEDPTEPR
jgi:RNA polymerase sigma-70 factor (ECF subfamily)